MQVVILCGGKGTRAYPYTEHMPKPMMPIAGAPILMHVMRIFASQGHTSFILSLGYLKEVIVDYFLHKHLPWNIQFVDTGGETDTGGRIRNLEHLLEDEFMATYADGLSNIRIDKLLEFHRSHPGMATVTSVPLISQYGTLEMNEGGCIQSFREKPVLREHWINAGFFVFDKGVFDHWQGGNLEKEVLPALVRRRLLYAYRHDGFFKSMDTYKEQQEIERMYQAGETPWRLPGDEDQFEVASMVTEAKPAAPSMAGA